MKDNNEMWDRLVKSHLQFTQLLQQFFLLDVDRTSMLKEGFRKGDIATALYVLPYLPINEQSLLLDELLLFVTSPGYSDAAKKILLSLPRDWLLANIEQASKSILISSDESDYRLLFELYLMLDVNLASNLAKKALEHSNKDIQEAGNDFMERISRER